MDALRARVLGQIDEGACVALIKKLVPAGQPAAENPADPDMPSGREEAFALTVADELRHMGLSVRMTETVIGRPNVMARLAGSTGSPRLILNDHLDTYPAGDPAEWDRTNFDPYNPTVIDRAIYGRGTSDTRGNMACQLTAVKAILKAGVKLEGDLQFVYTIDEERNGYSGARYLTKEGLVEGDYCIVSEPTSWTTPDDWGIDIAVAHAGHCLLEVETGGTKAHIWRPETGINAINHMVTLLQRLEGLELTHGKPQLYGSTRPGLCVVKVAGGRPGETGFTPNRCIARLVAVGLVPGMTPRGIIDDIRAVIEGVQSEDPTFEAEVRQLPGYTFIPGTEEIPEEAPPVRAIAGAYREITGKEPRYYRKNGYCDTIQFNLQGIPAITFGPGEDAWSPVNEYINIDKVLVATQVYACAIMDLLGVAGE